jgi:secreted Zn-dependent insulinase-like peptidase
LRLPIKNTLISNDIKIYDDDIDNNKLIKYDDDNNNIFYRIATKYKKPIAAINIKFYCIDIVNNIYYKILTKLYIMIFKMQIESYIYYAALAGYKLNIYVINDVICLHIDGYYQNILTMLSKILNKFINNKIHETRFQNAKNIYIEKLKNYYLSSPQTLANEKLRETSSKIYFTNKQILDELIKFKLEDMNNMNNIFKKLDNVTCLFSGNIQKKDVTKLNDIISYKTFKTSNKRDKNNYKRLIELNEGEKHVYESPSYGTNYFTEFVYEIGYFDYDEFALLNLFKIIISDKFFDKLRSEKQLGYIVGVNIKLMGHFKYPMTGLSLLVQSSKANNQILTENIKEFIDNAKSLFVDIQNYKDSLLQNVLETPKNMKDEFFRDLNGIDIEDNNYVNNLANSIKNIKIRDLTNFYEKYFINKKTRKLRINNIKPN